MIYCDYAATSHMSPAARAAFRRAENEAWANPSSAHKYGVIAAQRLHEARASIAQDLHCSPEEIYFTSGGTESDNWAVMSAEITGELSGKKHIVASAFEHPAVLTLLKYLKKRGFSITMLPAKNGYVNPSDVEAAIRSDTCLVTVMTVNNEVGSVQPVEEIGRICSERNIPFHTDAVQAAGHIPIDVQKIGCTFLSISAHKFGGPKGIGALYVKSGTTILPITLGGGQESGMRSGTENVPGAVAMAAALRDCYVNLNMRNRRVYEKREYLYRALQSGISGIRRNSPEDGVDAILNVSFDDVEGSALVLLLSEMGICVSAGSACHSGVNEPSRTLLAMGLDSERANSAIRFSLHHSMKTEDLNAVASAVQEAVSMLRRISPTP